jgi:hypothetical protein
MKTIYFISLLTIFAVEISHASVTKEDNQARLKVLQAKRTSTVWACKKGEQAPEAVIVFNVDPSVSQVFASTQILAVQDEQICSALNVTCPFVSGAWNGNYRLTGPVKYALWGSRGRYEDTLMFFSDGPGMKMVHISNGAQPSANWQSSWYFNPGECSKF